MPSLSLLCCTLEKLEEKVIAAMTCAALCDPRCAIVGRVKCVAFSFVRSFTRCQAIRS